MEIIDIKESIFKFKIESHTQIKRQILNSIDSMEQTPTKEPEKGQVISNQDFYLPKDERRPYWDIYFPHLQYSLQILRHNYNRNLEVLNFWYQQYDKGDYHSFHTHANCNYSSVYYVECPEGMTTSFLIRDEILDIGASEGDLIIFPSTLMHASKSNFTNQRKTIISTNLNYKE